MSIIQEDTSSFTGEYENIEITECDLCTAKFPGNPSTSLHGFSRESDFAILIDVRYKKISLENFMSIENVANCICPNCYFTWVQPYIDSLRKKNSYAKVTGENLGS
jgi:hypothetical protein